MSKFSLFDRFWKLTELIDQYLMHVNFSKLSNFHQFFCFLIDSHFFPFYQLVILLDIYKAYKISTISDARHESARRMPHYKAYFIKNRKSPEFRVEIFRE